MIKNIMNKVVGDSKKSKKEVLENKIDESNIPKHIAIIMDGNGRWAKKRNLPRTMGHKAGVETVRKILIESKKIGVKYLTLYTFSTENWKRPEEEVGALFTLLLQALKKEVEELNKNEVKLNFIGDIDKFPKDLVEVMYSSMEKTSKNNGITLNIALNYGGRDEITKSCKEICKEVLDGKLSIDDISEEKIGEHLYTKGMPDPELIIRPSGEQRLSNFLLWQCAYSEFWVSQIYWPDFKEEHLRKAIYDYQNRDRRFGGI